MGWSYYAFNCGLAKYGWYVHWIRFWHGMQDWIIEMFVHVHAVRNRCEVKPVLEFIIIKAGIIL